MPARASLIDIIMRHEEAPASSVNHAQRKNKNGVLQRATEGLKVRSAAQCSFAAVEKSKNKHKKHPKASSLLCSLRSSIVAICAYN